MKLINNALLQQVTTTSKEREREEVVLKIKKLNKRVKIQNNSNVIKQLYVYNIFIDETFD